MKISGQKVSVHIWSKHQKQAGLGVGERLVHGSDRIDQALSFRYFVSSEASRGTVITQNRALAQIFRNDS